MFKVLFISKFPPEKDGVGDYTYELVNYLSKYCNVYVLTYENNAKEKNVLRLIKSDNKFEAWNVSKIIKYINKELNIDLIHFQTASFTFRRDFYLFPLFIKIPLITTLHEILTLRQFHFLPFVYPLYVRSKKLIVLSKYMKNLIKKYNIKGSKIIFMHHGADINKFNLNVSRKAFLNEYKLEDGFNIMFLGFIGRGKGIDILIKAFYLIKEKIKDAKLIIAGGPKNSFELKYYNYLKTLTKSLKLEKRIFFTDYVPSDLLPSCIASADIFVLPYLSGFHKSGPLHKALASGKAIIATKICSFLEIIKHNYNGYLVKPNNIKELSKAILDLYINDSLRENLAKNARKFAEENLDWNIIVKKTLKIYENVLIEE